MVTCKETLIFSKSFKNYVKYPYKNDHAIIISLLMSLNGGYVKRTGVG